MKLLKALKGEAFEIPPVWIMRQAGRYLPEYRKLRQKKPSFMEFCLTPDLAIEATLQPLRRFDLDAAIIFSDILVIPEALGQKVSFVAGEGPQLSPIDNDDALKNIATTGDKELFSRVYEAIRGVRASLSKNIPLIGFSGGPWTVLTYMIEGKGSKGKGHLKALKLSLENPALFQTLMDRVVETTIEHLKGQVEAGADVLKIFESWASSVPASLRESLLYKPLSRIVASLKDSCPNTPLIVFPKGLPSEALSELRKFIKTDGIAYDASLSPEVISRNAQETIQTGPDPSFLLAGGVPLKEEVRAFKRAFSGQPYIFNLSHGIVPDAPIDHVHQMLEALKEG